MIFKLSQVTMRWKDFYKSRPGWVLGPTQPGFCLFVRHGSTDMGMCPCHSKFWLFFPKMFESFCLITYHCSSLMSVATPATRKKATGERLSLPSCPGSNRWTDNGAITTTQPRRRRLTLRPRCSLLTKSRHRPTPRVQARNACLQQVLSYLPGPLLHQVERSLILPRSLHDLYCKLRPSGLSVSVVLIQAHARSLQSSGRHHESVFVRTYACMRMRSVSVRSVQVCTCTGCVYISDTVCNDQDDKAKEKSVNLVPDDVVPWILSRLQNVRSTSCLVISHIDRCIALWQS